LAPPCFCVSLVLHLLSNTILDEQMKPGFLLLGTFLVTSIRAVSPIGLKNFEEATVFSLVQFHNPQGLTKNFAIVTLFCFFPPLSFTFCGMGIG